MSAKVIASCLIANAITIVVVGFLAMSYVDSKLHAVEASIDRVYGIVENGAAKIDRIQAVLVDGIENVDNAITKTKFYKRIFGEKDE